MNIQYKKLYYIKKINANIYVNCKNVESKYTYIIFDE